MSFENTMVKQLRAFTDCMRQHNASTQPEATKATKQQGCAKAPHKATASKLDLKTIANPFNPWHGRLFPYLGSDYLISGLYDNRVAWWRARFPHESLCIVSSDQFIEHNQEVRW